MSPARSCSLPSSVDTDWALAWLKVSGSAPYFSWLASVVASSWVKSPVIWVVPPLMALLIVGADTTRPSSVIATWLPTLAAV
jgi:hypothetical protein